MIRILVFTALLLIVFSAAKAQLGEWEIAGEMPIPVYGGRAVATDSLIYIIGGYSESRYAAVNYIQTYDPENNSWKLLEDTLLVPRFGFVADIYEDNLILMGGAPQNEEHVISMESWDFNGQSAIIDTSTEFNRAFSTGLIVDDILYIFGGYPDYRFWSDTLSIPYIFGYDLSAGEITYQDTEIYSNVSVDGSPPYQQMSAYFNNNIYIFGGAHNGILIEVFRFNLDDKSWVSVFPALFEERAAGAVVQATETMFLVMGGYNESSDALSSTEFYYPGYNFVEQGPDMSFARKELMAVSYKGNIYVFGGRDENGDVVSLVERINFQTTGIDYENKHKPGSMQLLGNYPNPFNPETRIRLHNQISQNVRLDVFDLNGRRIKRIYDDKLHPGSHEISWDGLNDRGSPAPSGIYIYHVITETGTYSDRMILLR